MNHAETLTPEQMNAAKLQAEIAQLMANTVKLGAETAKMQEEAAKLQRERRWYPVVVGVGTFATLLGASVAAVKLFA